MKLKKLVLTGLLVLIATGSALAEATFEGEASLGAYNKYIWRGYDLSGDADYLVQPEVSLGYGGVSLDLWGNYNEAAEKFDEFDLTVEYSHDFTEQLAARIGHINYMVDGAADSAEVYAGATLALPVDLDLELAYDYDEAEAWFLTFGVSKKVELGEEFGLNLGVAAGYNDFDYLNQGEATVALDYAPTEALTITPAALFSTPLSQDAEDAGIDDEFVASLTATYSF